MKFSSVKTSLKQSLSDTSQNLIDLFQKKINRLIIIMPKHPPRPIDALRQLFEDQQEQINSSSEIIDKQQEQINDLAKITLIQEGQIKRLQQINRENLKKESEVKTGGWFFA